MKSKKTPPRKSKASKPVKPTMDMVAIIEERFKHHVGIIVEDSNSKFQLILEVLSTKADKEDFRTLHAEMQGMKSKQEVIEQVVKGHSGILNQHTGILNEHSGILKEHSAALKEVMAKQEEHSTRLDRMETKLDQKADKEDIREIRNIFSNHERRLVDLESSAGG